MAVGVLRCDIGEGGWNGGCVVVVVVGSCDCLHALVAN